MSFSVIKSLRGHADSKSYLHEHSLFDYKSDVSACKINNREPVKGFHGDDDRNVKCPARAL